MTQDAVRSRDVKIKIGMSEIEQILQTGKRQRSGAHRQDDCLGFAAVDHLRGELFIDKMGPLARMGSKKYLDDYIEEFEEAKKKGAIPPGTEMKL